MKPYTSSPKSGQSPAGSPQRRSPSATILLEAKTSTNHAKAVFSLSGFYRALLWLYSGFNLPEKNFHFLEFFPHFPQKFLSSAGHERIQGYNDIMEVRNEHFNRIKHMAHSRPGRLRTARTFKAVHAAHRCSEQQHSRRIAGKSKRRGINIAKWELSPAFTRVRKKLGNMVYYDIDGEIHARKLPSKPETVSPAQSSTSASFKKVSGDWKYLTGVIQDSWKSIENRKKRRSA